MGLYSIREKCAFMEKPMIGITSMAFALASANLANRIYEIVLPLTDSLSPPPAIPYIHLFSLACGVASTGALSLNLWRSMWSGKEKESTTTKYLRPLKERAAEIVAFHPGEKARDELLSSLS